MWGAIWRLFHALFHAPPALLPTPSTVIPDGLKGRSGIHGAAFKPFQRLRRRSMDPGSAQRRSTPQRVRDDAGICFNVRIHHGRQYTAVARVFDIYRRNAGFKAEYPPGVVLLVHFSTYPSDGFPPPLAGEVSTPD